MRKQDFKCLLKLLFYFVFAGSVYKCQSINQNIDELIDSYYSEGLFNGAVLVAKHNSVLYKKALGIANREWDVPMSVDTKFKIGSISKSFTAIIILQLVDSGLVSLNDKISKYIPDYQETGRDIITVHQLLTHTSGIMNSLPVEGETIKEKQYHTLNDLKKYTEVEELKFEPGTRFYYSNFGYSILALIAENATQIPFTKLLEDRIFIPAGMNNSKNDLDFNVEKHLAAGYEYDLLGGYKNTTYFDNSFALGYGGITSTIEDLHKYFLALINNKLISDSLKIKMFTPSAVGDYGYGWFIDRTSIGPSDTLKIIQHTGSINGFGSYAALIPRDSIIVIILKNSRSHNYIRPAFSSSIGRKIISILYGEKVEVQKKSIAIYIGLQIGKFGIDSALKEYYKIKENNFDDFDFSESELNKLGIELLFKFNLKETALKIFELNMNEYPNSYNTYDSYAYTLMQMGKLKTAVEYYKAGLEILKNFPVENNTGDIQKEAAKARELIKKMESKIKTSIE